MAAFVFLGQCLANGSPLDVTRGGGGVEIDVCQLSAGFFLHIEQIKVNVEISSFRPIIETVGLLVKKTKILGQLSSSSRLGGTIDERSKGSLIRILNSNSTSISVDWTSI